MMKNCNLIIVDDHPIVTDGLAILLSRLDGINISASFKTGAGVLEYSDLNKTDIVLLDVFLPDMNGIEVCTKIKKMYPRIIVLAMSSQSERSIVMQMIKSGASGYLLKSATIEEFRDCIHLALGGKMTFSNEVKLIVEKTDINDLKAVPKLTKREKEILLLLGKGKSTQEISDLLFLSYLTIQTHRRNLLAKFQVKNAIELVNIVTENGLL